MVITVFNTTSEQDWLESFKVQGSVSDITLSFPKQKDQPLAIIRFSEKGGPVGSVLYDNHSIICYKNSTVTIDNKNFHINDKEDVCDLYKYLTGIDYLALEKQYKIENTEQIINKDFQ